MSEQTVLSEVDEGGIARITLNRPDLHNAMNDRLIAELDEAFRGVSAEASVRAVVLAGNGQSFCAGGDLNWMRRTADYGIEENLADARVLARMLDAIDRCPKPVIGLIQGNIYGGGNGLVCAVDIAIAADTARFCLSEVRLGLMPSTISPYVVRAMGARAARRYFLTSEVMDAAEAHRLGMVHERVPEAELEAAGARIIKALLAGGPNAIAASKELIERVRYGPVDEAMMEYTARGIAEIRATDEGKEGAEAFLEKRKPAWRT
jgi:methylglutaconyl-CoA hydratase